MVAVLLVPFLAISFLVIALVIKLTSKGPVLYWSDRVGRENQIFRMPKFRTMRMGTVEMPTHLLTHPETYITPLGRLLRVSSLDELPQIYSVLRGDLSLVGPRPALFNQHDLITMRTERNIHHLLPGITGWAQVNGRDLLTLEQKVDFDTEYLARQSFWFDAKILFLTFATVLKGEHVQH